MAELEARLAEAIELATEAVAGRDRADASIKQRDGEIAELTAARDAAELSVKTLAITAGTAGTAGPGTEAPANKPPPPPPGPPPSRAKEVEQEGASKERAPKRRHSLIPKPNSNRHSLGGAGVAPNPTPVEAKPERSTRSKTTKTAAASTESSASGYVKFYYFASLPSPP